MRKSNIANNNEYKRNAHSSSIDAMLSASTQISKDSKINSTKQVKPKVMNLKKYNSSNDVATFKTKTRQFLPINEINVHDRKMIRKVSEMTNIKNEQYHLKQYYSNITPIKPTLTSSMSSFALRKTVNNRFLSTKNIKYNLQRKFKVPLSQLIKRNPYHYVSVSLKEDIDFNTKLSKKFTQPNIIGHTKSKNQNITKPIKMCTFYIKKQPLKSNLIQRLININKEKNEFMSSNFKLAIKWEGICKLWENHALILEKLIKYYTEYKWFLEKDTYISIGIFKEFLHLVHIEDHSSFCDDVFALFSPKSNTMDIKEFFQSIIIVSENTTYEFKLKFLCDVWETANTNHTNLRELSHLLKYILHSKKDYDIIIKKLREYTNCDKILTTQIEEIFISDVKIKNILERILLRSRNTIHNIYNDEIANVINGNIRSWKYNMSDHDIQMNCGGETEQFEKLLRSISQCEKKRKRLIEIKIENNLNDV